MHLQALLIYSHSNNINNMVQWKVMQSLMKALTSFKDKWNPLKNNTLSQYENVTYLLFKNTLMLHNYQLLFCCNNLLILHGKPHPHQFLPQLPIFTFHLTYFCICMVLQVVCNKVCSSQTLSISNNNMSYEHRVCCFKQLPFFSPLVWAYCQVV